MGNWNSSSDNGPSEADYDSIDSGVDPSSARESTFDSYGGGDGDREERIGFISPTTGRASTGNWNVAQAKAAGTQSAVIDGRTIYGSNAALAALGDPSSQYRENVIAGYPAFVANKAAQQREMDRLLGIDLSSKIGKAADAAGVPRSEISFLSGGTGLDDSGFKSQEGTAITFSAGTGDKIGMPDDRSFLEKVGDFIGKKGEDFFEGKPERDFVVGTTVDPVTGLTSYSPAYQVVNENNFIDAFASRINPFVSIDTKRLQDPVSRQYYSYSDIDMPFGADRLFGDVFAPKIQNEQVAKAAQQKAALESSIAEAQSGGGGFGDTQTTASSIPVGISKVPMGRDQYSPMRFSSNPFLVPFGLGIGSAPFYTSTLPNLQSTFSLLR